MMISIRSDLDVSAIALLAENLHNACGYFFHAKPLSAPDDNDQPENSLKDTHPVALYHETAQREHAELISTRALTEHLSIVGRLVVFPDASFRAQIGQPGICERQFCRVRQLFIPFLLGRPEANDVQTKVAGVI
jgi:hypothetical protein